MGGDVVGSVKMVGQGLRIDGKGLLWQPQAEASSSNEGGPLEMNNEERDTLLIRVDGRVERIEKSWEEHKVLHSGPNGVEKRFQRIEMAMAIIKGNKTLVITLFTLLGGMTGFLILLFGVGVTK